MQGYQFAHMETWSRKGVAKQNGNEKNVRRNGQRGWTAEQILDEAAREPWASEHVGRARRDPSVIAGTCKSFDELRDAHDAACKAKIAVPYTNPKTKKKGTRKKAVRVDTHTLYTAVISFPVTSVEALEDAEKMAECRRAIDLVIVFEKRRLEDAGGEFAMGVVHLDETYVHLHVYGLDRQRGSVNGLHPGKAALDDFRALHGAISRKGSDLFQRSRRAYCDAMREWQDDLHREALGKVGLCRYGPRRTRSTRGQWMQRKNEEEERAKARETISTLGKIRSAQVAADDAMAAREANVVEMKISLDADRTALAGKRKSIEEKGRRLDAGLAAVEGLAEDYLELRETDEGHRVVITPKAKESGSLWPELRERIRHAPNEVGRIGGMIGASLLRLRQETMEQAREGALARARQEVEERFPGLGAIHRFARDLIARLPSKDRQEATERLSASCPVGGERRQRIPQGRQPVAAGRRGAGTVSHWRPGRIRRGRSSEALSCSISRESVAFSCWRISTRPCRSSRSATAADKALSRASICRTKGARASVRTHSMTVARDRLCDLTAVLISSDCPSSAGAMSRLAGTAWSRYLIHAFHAVSASPRRPRAL